MNCESFWANDSVSKKKGTTGQRANGVETAAAEYTPLVTWLSPSLSHYGFSEAKG